MDQENKQYNGFDEEFESLTKTTPILIVYTDGACRNNQKREKARASYAVFFGDDDTRNESEMVPLKPWTNNRGELYAILRAIELSKKEIESNCTIQIHTDSSYCYDIFTDYIFKWRNNGYTTKNGEHVKNYDIIKEIDDLLLNYNKETNTTIVFVKVAAHSKIYGNEMADKMCKKTIINYDKLITNSK